MNTIKINQVSKLYALNFETFLAFRIFMPDTSLKLFLKGFNRKNLIIKEDVLNSGR